MINRNDIAVYQKFNSRFRTTKNDLNNSKYDT